MQDVRHFIREMARVVVAPAFARLDFAFAQDPTGSDVVRRQDKMNKVQEKQSRQSRWLTTDVDQSAATLMMRSEELLMSFLVNEWHIGKFFSASKQWHKTFGRNLAEPVRVVESTPAVKQHSWPEWCKPQVAPNGISIVPLTTPGDLRTEGLEMAHCVGSYVSVCKDCYSQVFSVRDANGKRLSTLQLRYHDDSREPRGFSIQILQNRGKYNEAPPSEALAAGHWLKEQFEARALPNPAAAIEAARLNETERKTLSRLESYTEICEFSPIDDDAWERAYLEFRRYLPPPYRELKPQEFVTRITDEAFLRIIAGVGNQIPEKNSLST